MNIMALKIGDRCISKTGICYRIVRDEVERVSIVGRVTVRIAQDPTGRVHKFIRGIEVDRLTSESSS
jgi:hypothetical protein